MSDVSALNFLAPTCVALAAPHFLRERTPRRCAAPPHPLPGARPCTAGAAPPPGTHSPSPLWRCRQSVSQARPPSYARSCRPPALAPLQHLLCHALLSAGCALRGAALLAVRRQEPGQHAGLCCWHSAGGVGSAAAPTAHWAGTGVLPQSVPAAATVSVGPVHLRIICLPVPVPACGRPSSPRAPS